MTPLSFYIDMFKNRMLRLNLNLTINDQQIVNYINKARIDIANKVRGYVEEYYSDIFEIDMVEDKLPNNAYNSKLYSRLLIRGISGVAEQISAYALPPYLIDIRAIIVREDLKDTTPFKNQFTSYVTARATRVEEFANVIKHRWNAPISSYPIYLVEKNVEDNYRVTDRQILYVAGVDTSGTKGYTAFVFYTRIPPLLQYLSDDLNDLNDYYTPSVFVNLVIDRALLYYLRDMSYEGSIAISPLLIRDMENTFSSEYVTTFAQEILSPPSKEETQ